MRSISLLKQKLSKEQLKANHNKAKSWCSGPGLKQKLSKEQLKANHNIWQLLIRRMGAETKIVKGTIESKSQQHLSINWSVYSWNKNCQRNNWKQITTLTLQGSNDNELKQKLSKEQLKANHNVFTSVTAARGAETKIVKGTIESKSQRQPTR